MSLPLPQTVKGDSASERLQNLGLGQNARVDLAYKVRKNEHPEFGGIELEIADLRTSDGNA